MLVREVLKIKGDRLVSVVASLPLLQAVDIMVRNDIGSLIVMDGAQDQKMIGILTFREVLVTLRKTGNLDGAVVADCMVSEPASASPDDTVDQMRTLMTERHIRYLPIVDGTRLLGVLSFHDVAKAALKAASFENKLLKTYIKNWPETPAKV